MNNRKKPLGIEPENLDSHEPEKTTNKFYKWLFVIIAFIAFLAAGAFLGNRSL